MLGDVPRLRINCGDLLGDLSSNVLFSLSGEGVLPPVAEFLREDPMRTSKCRNLKVLLESSVLLNKNASGHEIQDDSLKTESD